MKQTVHGVILLTLAIGAAFSYDQVRFGERTASFFRVAFAEDDSGHAGRERRGHGHRGASISLEEVTYYTIVFVFATMLTGTIDGLLKKASRARKTAARE